MQKSFSQFEWMSNHFTDWIKNTPISAKIKCGDPNVIIIHDPIALSTHKAKQKVDM